MAIWLRGLERWYLVLGGVVVGRGFEPQSDLELFFAEILMISIREQVHTFQLSCTHFQFLQHFNLSCHAATGDHIGHDGQFISLFFDPSWDIF
jgi:hypothetical protein